MLRPFEYFMEVLLDWHKLRGHVDLEGVTMTLVSCRQPNDTTGPTFKYALLALHLRERRTSAYVSGIGESQITGIQTNPCSLHAQLTRATHESIVYLHDFPCGTPRDKVDPKDVPPQWQKRLAFMNHYRDLAGEYEWTAVDCDKKGAPDPVLENRGGRTHVLWAPWLPRHVSGCWTVLRIVLKSSTARA